MPLDILEAFSAVTELLGLVRQFTRALGKASAGGRRITPGEWADIKAKFDGWLETTARDYVD